MLKLCPRLWSLGSWSLVFGLEMVLFPDMSLPESHTLHKGR